MSDDLLDAWISVIRIERVPRDLQLAVLRRLIQRIERSDPRRPKGTKRGRPPKSKRRSSVNHAAATDKTKTEVG